MAAIFHSHRRWLGSDRRAVAVVHRAAEKTTQTQSRITQTYLWRTAVRDILSLWSKHQATNTVVATCHSIVVCVIVFPCNWLLYFCSVVYIYAPFEGHGGPTIPPVLQLGRGLSLVGLCSDRARALEFFARESGLYEKLSGIKSPRLIATSLYRFDTSTTKLLVGRATRRLFYCLLFYDTWQLDWSLCDQPGPTGHRVHVQKGKWHYYEENCRK